MNYTNYQIYEQYQNSKLINELASNFIDEYNARPDNLEKRGKIL